MDYYKYLKRGFPFYIISGLIFSLVLTSLIIINKYNSGLSETINVLNEIKINRERIKTQLDEASDLNKYFIDTLGMDLTYQNSEALIFRSLDDIKTFFRGATITVEKMAKVKGRKELPMEIMGNMKSYNMIIGYINYLESFRVPDYRINSLSVMKETSGNVVLRIKGSLVMPSIKKENKRSGRPDNG